MSVLSCCLWNSASILPSSGDDILIFPVENFPFPMGAPAPRSGNRRLRPDVTRMCQPLCYNDWLRANGKFFKWLEWEGVCACVCVCVFSAKRKYGTEEHTFCTHGLGLNPSCPVSLPSDQVALGESLIFPGSQSSSAKWGKNPPCLKGCYGGWMHECL